MSRTVDNRAYYAKQTAARNTLIEPVNYIVNVTTTKIADIAPQGISD